MASRSGRPFANVGEAHRRGVYAARSVLPVHGALLGSSVRFGRMSQLVDRGRRTAGGRPVRPRRVSRVRRGSARLATGRLKPLRRLARDLPVLHRPAGAGRAGGVIGQFFTDDTASAIVLSVVFIGLQAVAGLVPARHRFLTPRGWMFLRLTIALLYVWALVNTVGGPARPLFPLYLPVVVAAAALGPAQAIVIGVHRGRDLPRARTCDAARPGHRPGPAGRRRADAPWARPGRRVDRARDRDSAPRWPAGTGERPVPHRGRVRAPAVAPDRRPRSGQPPAGHGRGHAELLERVADVMVERFGYALAVIFIVEDNRSSSGRSAATPSTASEFDPRTGVVGRAARSGRCSSCRTSAPTPTTCPATAAS